MDLIVCLFVQVACDAPTTLEMKLGENVTGKEPDQLTDEF
jgi:hypothetical protein